VTQLIVRPARADDQDAILAFCQHTFRWGDYIPRVWNDWLRDSGGQILIAEWDHQPVGMLHVAFLDDGIAWLEGMRVHPDHRRRGLASAMDAYGRACARARGCGAARLVTGKNNLASQSTLDALGYRRVVAFNEWETKSLARGAPLARVASGRDAARILNLWRDSKTYAASHGVLPDPRWRWRPLSDDRLRGHLRFGEARVMEDAFVLLHAESGGDWIGITIYALCGDAESVRPLARAVRVEARYRGFPNVEAILADESTVNAVMRDAGYRQTGGIFLYEMELK
jgi:ribosomal protein S18 acetylase RimI-like enzyme